MNPLIQELIKNKPVILDGAWGTEMQKMGLSPGECPDHWNIAHPQQVEQIARSYADAGSNIILTNTFGANRVVLSRHGLDAKLKDINAAGVELSLKAAGNKAKVFASVGPSGKMLMTGEVTEDELYAAFSEQVQVLAGAGAHGIVLETFSDLEEARIALRAVKETGLPLVVNMVFDSGQYKDYTLMGVSPEQFAEEMENAGADVIGANCGIGIENYLLVFERLKSSTRLPVWIKANAGLPELTDGGLVYNTSPGEFAAHAKKLITSGVAFIGGCCGTTPEFIRALAEIR